MLYDFDVDFLDDDRIKVTEREQGDFVIFKCYEGDPTLYMIELNCGPIGMDRLLLEEAFEAAETEILIRVHEEYDECCQPHEENRRDAELKALADAAGGFGKSSGEDVLDFFLERDLKLLGESPEKFFQPLDMTREFPESQNDYTGSQLFVDPVPPDTKLPEELKSQLDEFYVTRYTRRLGYPAVMLAKPRDEEKLAYPGLPSGILFVDRDHVFGIVQFPSLKGGFADFWHRRRIEPVFYCNDSKELLLVKKFDLAEDGGIADPNWQCFFSVLPYTVRREYNDFLRDLRRGKLL